MGARPLQPAACRGALWGQVGRRDARLRAAPLARRRPRAGAAPAQPADPQPALGLPPRFRSGPAPAANRGPSSPSWSSTTGPSTRASRGCSDSSAPPREPASCHPTTSPFSSPPGATTSIPPTRRMRGFLAELIPAVERSVRVRPGPAGRVCMGASLGGLAMLHAHRLHPDLCAGCTSSRRAFPPASTTTTRAGCAAYPRVVRFVELGPGGARLPHPTPSPRC